MRTDAANRAGQLAPALRTLAAIVFLVVAVGLLGLGAGTGTAHSAAVTTAIPWLVWRVVGSVAALVFVLLLVRATRLLLGGSRPHGRRLAVLVGVALVVVLLGGTVVVLGSIGATRNRTPLPIDAVGLRTGALLLAGALAAVPWLALAWLVHAECRTVSRSVGRSTTTAAHREAVLRLGRAWERIVACVTAFGVGVVAALATTGALRAVFLHAFPNRAAEFPPGYVLLYGVPFLVAVLVITVPLVAAWRSAATRLLECVVPVPADLRLTDGWANQRARLAALLRLDVPLLRSPLTVVSAVVPLVFTLVAAFLPELAVR